MRLPGAPGRAENVHTGGNFPACDVLVSVHWRLLEEVVAIGRPHPHVRDIPVAPKGQRDYRAWRAQVPRLAVQLGELGNPLASHLQDQVARPHPRASCGTLVRKPADDQVPLISIV